RDSAIHSIINSLRDENLEDCFEYIREIFRGIDYDLQISQEKYYQTVFYLIFSLIGMKIKTEVKTNIGRIDAVIDDNHTYIFEFKLNGTKAQALQQIKDRKYHEKYTNKGKSIYLIGVEFQNRNIGEYVYEIIPR
nr:PD-(D/E)XK nuclease domain-containing protein [Leptospiraceae bacterium]